MSTDNWYDELLKKYPIVFKDLKYLECSKGWYKLIDNLAEAIESHISHSIPDELKDDIYAVQVKQKFGSLRFYMNHETPYITGAIAVAENLSNDICEECGNLGDRRNVGGWITTLCESDYIKTLDLRSKRY